MAEAGDPRPKGRLSEAGTIAASQPPACSPVRGPVRGPGLLDNYLSLSPSLPISPSLEGAGRMFTIPQRGKMGDAMCLARVDRQHRSLLIDPGCSRIRMGRGPIAPSNRLFSIHLSSPIRRLACQTPRLSDASPVRRLIV